MISIYINEIVFYVKEFSVPSKHLCGRLKRLIVELRK
jgi:hypothetical protein